MIILNNDIVGIAFFPAEADAPLLIDTDAELSFAVSLKCFETVRWRNTQVVEVNRLIKHSELVQSPLLNLSRQFSRFKQGPKAFRLSVSKAFYHYGNLIPFPQNVNIISAKRS